MTCTEMPNLSEPDFLVARKGIPIWKKCAKISDSNFRSCSMLPSKVHH